MCDYIEMFYIPKPKRVRNRMLSRVALKILELDNRAKVILVKPSNAGVPPRFGGDLAFNVKGFGTVIHDG